VAGHGEDKDEEETVGVLGAAVSPPPFHAARVVADRVGDHVLFHLPSPAGPLQGSMDVPRGEYSYSPVCLSDRGADERAPNPSS
jgi:hypothetical protein